MLRSRRFHYFASQLFSLFAACLGMSAVVCIHASPTAFGDCDVGVYCTDELGTLNGNLGCAPQYTYQCEGCFGAGGGAYYHCADYPFPFEMRCETPEGGGGGNCANTEKCDCGQEYIFPSLLDCALNVNGMPTGFQCKEKCILRKDCRTH